MPKRNANISLSSYDDIFSTEESRAEAKQERVQEIPLSELHPFEGHPFRVVDDEDMMKRLRVSVNTVFSLLPLFALTRMVAMRLSPVTDDTTHLNLLARRPCLLLSVIWTMMPP